MHDIDPAVQEYIEGLPSERRRREATTLIDLFGRITGHPAWLYGTIIGFGQYHYKYASGREGDAAAAAFAPRKAAISVYLPDGVDAHEDLLANLGPHRTGVGCLYISNLDSVDVATLEAIVAHSWATLTSGTYTQRARENGQG